MKIGFKGYLKDNHSWAIVQRNLAYELIKKGYDVLLYPTDSGDGLKENGLDKYIYHKPEQVDISISYTAMKNFQEYLKYGKKKFGIWCSETDYIPLSFISQAKYADYILPPSKFSKDIFMKHNINENKLKILPHGYRISDEVYDLKTDKKIKVLIVIGQPHYRKGIDKIFEAISIFNKSDDIVFIFKISKKLKKAHDVNFDNILKEFKNKNTTNIIIIDKYIENIYSLYNACNVSLSLSRGEAFHIPSLDGLAYKHIVISSNYGGAKDFLNDENSLLINGNLKRAPLYAQYWGGSNYASFFEPDIDDARNKLMMMVKDFDNMKDRFNKNSIDILREYAWENVCSSLEKLF